MQLLYFPLSHLAFISLSLSINLFFQNIFGSSETKLAFRFYVAKAF